MYMIRNLVNNKIMLKFVLGHSIKTKEVFEYIKHQYQQEKR